MIIGIGSDLVDIRRIERLISRFGPRFTGRVFTAQECARAHAQANPAASFAKRFAAKEACAKALGTGLAGGVFWQDMEITNGATGVPLIGLTGGAAARLAAMTPAGCAAHLHLTLTDEYPLAQAFVMISAESACESGRESGRKNLAQGIP